MKYLTEYRDPVLAAQYLEEIKKTERLKGIPVFVYSTSTDEKDILNLEKGGAIMFISKPTDPREVYYLISNIIGEKWI